MAVLILALVLLAIILFATQAFISRENRREQTTDMRQFSRMQEAMEKERRRR